MRYRGYIGTIQYDPSHNTYYGNVKHVRTLITYGDDCLMNMETIFQRAVDNYLLECKLMGVEPEIPKTY